METKIYLVCEKSSYDGNFSTWAPFKAFQSKENANEYAEMIKQYNLRNKIEGIKREVFIKEIEFGK